MHRSRMYGLFVDVPADQASAAIAFWSAALGVPPVRGDEDGDPYTALPGAVGTLAVEVQAVDDQPRYHVDIETDDVHAEVRRLTAVARPRWRVRRAGWCCAPPAATCSAWCRCRATGPPSRPRRGPGIDRAGPPEDRSPPGLIEPAAQGAATRTERACR